MPQVETVSTTPYATRTDTTITAPTGIASGDMLVAYTVTGDGGGAAPDPAPPAGFTVLPGAWPSNQTLAGFNLRVWAFSKTATGSEPGTYTFTHTSSGAQGAMFRVSGPFNASPFTPTPTLNAGVTADSTFTGVTTTVDGTLILLFHVDFGDTGANLTPPAGSTPTFTEYFDTGASAGLIYGAAGVLATAGATGDKTFPNNSNTGNTWIATLAAIAPPASGASFVLLPPSPVRGAAYAAHRAASI